MKNHKTTFKIIPEIINLRVACIILFTGVFVESNAQNLNNLTFNATESGNQTHVACQTINFEPGYEYYAQGTTSMDAHIDPYMVCDVDYLSSEYTPQNLGPLNTSYEVGTTPGTFDVSPTGAATYAIPLIAPPGTMGMTPNLSVVYSSQGGNGLMGWGWALAGLSSITRAPSPPYYSNDVWPHPVTLSNSDWFMLDGARLFGNSGPYGGDGVSYHTEAESYSRIISHGSTGGVSPSPMYFTVETKDGKTLEYGNTADSRIEAQGTSDKVLTWLLNKITDSNGNSIKIYYYENNSTGEFRPDYIDYTINPLAGISDPYNKVKFVYGTRGDDKQKVYEAGYAISQTVLLVGIHMFSEDKFVREYVFKYAYDNNVGSHLSEVIEKGANGSQFNPIKIGWTVSQNTNVPNPNYNTDEIPLPMTPSVTNAHQKYPGDYNGDGFTDLLLLSTPNSTFAWELYLNDKGTGFPGSHHYTGYFSNGYRRPVYGSLNPRRRERIVDFDGDGKDDLLLYTVSGGVDQYLAMIWTGSDFVTGGPFHPDASTDSEDANGDPQPDNAHIELTGDFDGDGATDLFLYYYVKNTWYIWGHINTYSSGLGAADWGSNLMYHVIDFDGDGKDEIMCLTPFTLLPPYYFGANFIMSLDEDGNLPFVVDGGAFPNGCMRANSTSNADGTLYTGDFNGDGKTDILIYDDYSYQWKIGYAVRTSLTGGPIQYQPFTAPPIYLPPYYSGNPTEDTEEREVLVADFNGDGKSDIGVFYHTNGGYNKMVRVWFSLGNNTFHEQYLELPDDYPVYAPSTPWEFFLNITTTQLADFNGDGHSDIIFKSSNNTIRGIYFLAGSEPAHDYNRVTSITNGLNETVFIDYNTLPVLSGRPSPDEDFYLVGTGSSSPVHDIQKPFSVVSLTKGDNGVGGQNTTKFRYDGAKYCFEEKKGFLGFAKITARAMENNVKTVSEFAINTSAYISYLSRSAAYKHSSNTLLSEKLFSYNVIPVSWSGLGGLLDYKLEMTQQTATDAVRNYSVVRTYNYDGNGNITREFVNIASGLETVETLNSYVSCGQWWIPSKLETSTVISKRDELCCAPETLTRVAHFTYDSHCNVTNEYKDWQQTKQVQTTYDYYNNTGAVNHKTIIASGPASPAPPPPRTTTYHYDNKFRFVTQEENPLGQTAQVQYDARWGVPLAKTGIDGLVTTYKYDGFGRNKKVTTPDGLAETIQLAWESSLSCANDPGGFNFIPCYSASSTKPGSPAVKKFYDKLGREIKMETDGFLGKVSVAKKYNGRGSLEKESGPYYCNGSPQLPTLITTHLYHDNQGLYLLYQSNISDGSSYKTTNFLYSFNSGSPGNTKVTVDAPAEETWKITDPAGRVVKAHDEGGDVEYSYFSAGQIKEIKVNGAVKNSMTYDNPYGFQYTLTDQSAGTITYVHDALGQLRTQTDANTNSYSMEYNDLGQCTSKTKTGSPAETYSYTYVSSGNGLNLVSTINSQMGSDNITYTYAYDQLNRLTSYQENINSEIFTTSYQYDMYSNVSRITYPGNFAIDKLYDSNGNLTDIKNGSSTIWHGYETTAEGVYNKYGLGNGANQVQSWVTYNNFRFPTRYYTPSSSIQDLTMTFNTDNGNLEHREDALIVPNVYEDFIYDNSNRLLSSQVANLAPCSLVYNSDNTIASKTDAGTYAYNSSDKPDAVRSVTNPSNTINPLQQNITYTAFNKAERISENGYELNITYGPDQQRKKSILKYGGNPVSTKYFHPGFEKLIKGADTWEITYITAPSGLCAMYVKKNSDPGNLYYVYTDHLGSILTLVDVNGSTIFAQNFDAWGRYRNTGNWSYVFNTSNLPDWLYRGFTGHEHLPEFGLINMNGRMYDPVLGVMLSPDNYVQQGGNTLNYNRYSYCFNNPLKYADPSGDWLLAAVLIGAMMNVAMQDYAGNLNSFADYGGAALIGAASGAAGYGAGAAAAGAAGIGGFGGGFIAGGAGGFAGGFFLGSGNAAANGAGNALEAGLMMGGMDGIGGAISGGILAGIDAAVNGANFWDGTLPIIKNSPFYNRYMYASGTADNYRTSLQGGGTSTSVSKPFYESKFAYILHDEDFGYTMGGSFSVKGGYYTSTFGSQSRLHVVASGYSVADQLGDINFTGEASLYVDGKIQETNAFIQYGGYQFQTPGWHSIGSTSFIIPNSGRIDLGLRFSYYISVEGGTLIPVTQPVVAPFPAYINKIINIR